VKSILPYTANNNLNYYLRKRQAEITINKKDTVLLAEIEFDLANYCGISTEGIRRIKRGLSVASLPVALKISEFFDVKVSDIFYLTNKQ
jgi:DNA-binding XRE family transcriptional regulator